MKKFVSVLWKTLMNGIVFLIPIIVFIVVIDKAVTFLMDLSGPIADVLPYKSFFGLDKDYWAGLLVLIAIAFLAGIIASAKHAVKLKNWLEENILCYVPGYMFMKISGEQMVGYREEKSYEVVMVRFDEYSQLGYLIEEIDELVVAVYVPDAPDPMDGELFYINRDRITPMDISYTKTQSFIKKLGLGSGKYLKGKIKNSPL
jgi:uncharacterized membrane protein